jgi:hypothetical protein
MARIRLIPLKEAGSDLKRAYLLQSQLWASRAPVVAQINQCLAHRPAFIELSTRGYGHLGWEGRLPRTVKELTGVLVSRENHCFY